MLNLINEFISLDRNYFLEEYELQSGDVIDFLVEELNSPPRVTLKLIALGNLNYLRNIDFKELVEFINNPELLRNQKKFNI